MRCGLFGVVFGVLAVMLLYSIERMDNVQICLSAHRGKSPLLFPTISMARSEVMWVMAVESITSAWLNEILMHIYTFAS